jgi:hypothetical protein
LEGNLKKKISDFIGTRTRDLSALTIYVPHAASDTGQLTNRTDVDEMCEDSRVHCDIAQWHSDWTAGWRPV